ncbi:C-type lectin Cal-like [Pantherophis guttatus]|uniref:C-type lectin Cal-like n=1 Tax=Pantherophis guttatus TaxID=94885 RepID=A0A6P9B880_PANGU|nr:C-type lectin Cal-like [Pantherophis guttatus]
MRPWIVYNCSSESKTASEGDPAQLSTTSAHPGEEHRKVNQKMALLTYFSFSLLGIFFAGPFFQVEADTCAREWLQNQGNCYAYFDQKLTWHEAEIECQSYGRGAHLASILTKAETLLVAEHVSTYQREFSNVWIGLHDVRQTGKWRWADESTYNYKSWMNYQPDNYDKNEHCVELRRSTGFKLWNDIQCNTRNAYICKHEL